MNVVFAGASFWIAMLNPRDALHEKALSAVASLGAAHVMTSQMVLAELLNDFAARGPVLRDAAARLVRDLSRNPNTTVIGQTPAQFDEAVRIYAERADKGGALTDCASFAIMKMHGINLALTHDRHFHQMGFTPLLR